MTKWYETFCKLSQRAQMRVVKIVCGVVVLTTILIAATTCSASEQYWLTVWLDDEPVLSRGELEFDICRFMRIDMQHRYDDLGATTVTVTCTPWDPINVVAL